MRRFISAILSTALILISFSVILPAGHSNSVLAADKKPKCKSNQTLEKNKQGKYYCKDKPKNGGGGGGAGGGGASPATVGPSTPSDQAACEGLSQLGGEQCSAPGSVSAAQTTVGRVTSGIVNIISIIAGMVGVIMIIVAGVKYTTSGGDSAKIGSAKSTLVYALIGIAIAALAQILVHFALHYSAG